MVQSGGMKKFVVLAAVLAWLEGPALMSEPEISDARELVKLGWSEGILI
jgi:hypothetical protein